MDIRELHKKITARGEVEKACRRLSIQINDAIFSAMKFKDHSVSATNAAKSLREVISKIDND